MSLVADDKHLWGKIFREKMEKEINDNKSPIRVLITTNLTKYDNFFNTMFDKLTVEKQIDYIAKLPPLIRSNINAKKQFTDEFLELVNDYINSYEKELLKITENDYYYGIFGTITVLFKSFAGNYGQVYTPSNRLYFLFLANVYCHSNEYYPMYKWLKELLEMFEGLGLTGLFYISPPDYNKLFNDCNKLNGMPDTETQGDNKDKIIISNTTIAELIKNSDICRFGDNCTRLNVEHRIKYHSYVPPASSKTPYARPSGTGTQGTGTQRARPSKLKGPSGSIKQRAGTKKNRPKKTHKKRQYKHKKRHNKSKKLI